jgi:hypothetical protein
MSLDETQFAFISFDPTCSGLLRYDLWTLDLLYGLQIDSGLFYFVQTKASDAAKKKK